LTNQRRRGKIKTLIGQHQEGGVALISRFEMFSVAISNIYRSIQKIEREEMDRYGLKGGYAQYLVALDRFPEGLTSAKLCEICDVDKAAVSRSVAEMERLGLLERDTSNVTGYRAKIVLTEKGSKLAAYINQRAQQAVDVAGCDLNETEQKVLYASLVSISARLQEISREGIPNVQNKE